MRELLYLFLLGAGIAAGYQMGFAGHSWTKWIAAPIFAFLIGQMIRMFWGQP